MKLKILVMPNNTYPTSHTFLEEVFANILHNKGHKITWVMQSGEKLKKNKVVSWKGTEVYVTIASPGTSRFGRLTNHIFRVIGKILIIHKIVKNKKFDIIQVREGIIEGLIAVYIKKRYGIPFSFQYTFPSPEGNVYAFKKGMARYPIIYYLRGKISEPILLWIMSKADLVLPVSKRMEKELVKKGISQDKIMVFPMGVNVSFLPQKISRVQIRKKLKLNTSPTLIYIGTMDVIRELDFLLRVISKIKKNISDIRLLMVGNGNDRPRLEKLTKTLGIRDNVVFTGQISRSNIPNFITSADVGVSPIPSVPIFKVGSATKIVEYMAMGKPVVGNDIADQKEVINDSGGGICTKYDEKEFADGIIWLLKHPREAKEMGKRGREWVVKNRNYELLTEKLEQKYYEIIKRQKMMNKYSGDIQ